MPGSMKTYAKENINIKDDKCFLYLAEFYHIRGRYYFSYGAPLQALV